MEAIVTFRLMTLEDIDDVLLIENASFATPWSREAFYNEIMNNHFAHYIVMLEQDKVIGYCGMWLVMDEAHITNIAILPEYRGRKLGEALMVQVKKSAMSQGANRMTLEVRVSNSVAQSLYRKHGFTAGGIRKKYYTDNQEDAIVMWVNLDVN
ncbi:ribosomal protein S18-alanine N-acetyltransferase [Litchfieldia salsa]|uniref:[Ribosomal protein bS18]-alanine N-acetyltransferase n=1 Tax=Litchfieldia salsa TaxID=930152 RepID=A0A1H0WSJ6_9BACI|nr:ribosomal protein S18-alanine N-acetyltransferase [Litchfieldia salsa]SDP93216.1 ribosomal-protein-alanine N-acetyltransferase [Litchfieldia salsa]